MKPDYKNWVPKGMIYGLTGGAVAACVALVAFGLLSTNMNSTLRTVILCVLAVACVALIAFAGWSIMAHQAFSYDGKRKLSKQIVEGTAEHVRLPAGGKCLDVGCGSGALTIAVAKRNPRANVVGVDRWGAEYASFSRSLCESNARAEGVANTSFRKGDATKLDFPDESFDAVTSNYVYHNITGADKQQLLLETLRVLKKGGTFAIHDIMSPARYGNMKAFVDRLKKQGYERVELIDTTDGRFMTRGEAKRLMLTGSTLLVGKK